jgi:hypothetical protein
MLVRPQVVVFVPVLLFLIGWVCFRRRAAWLKGSLLLVVGLVLVISPWLWRNYRVAGELTLQETDEVRLVGQVFSDPQEWEKYGDVAGESQSQFLLRVLRGVIGFTLTRPGEVVDKVLPHFLHNLNATLLVLPASFRYADVDDYVREMPVWGQGWWDGYLPSEAVVPLVLNLVFIAVGLGWAWRQRRVIGITPFIFYLAYDLTTAAVRYSGRRYILPVDWIILLYYCLGIVQFLRWGLLVFSSREFSLALAGDEGATSGQPDAPQSEKWPLFSPRLLGVALGLILVGAALPFAEFINRPSYVQPTEQEALALLREYTAGNPSGVDLQATIEEFLEDDAALVLVGRALYPQSYAPDQDFFRSGLNFHQLVPRPYARLGFYLIGPHEDDIFLRIADPPPLPNASDVLVFGCQSSPDFDALAVIVMDKPGEVLLWEPLPPLGCPLDDRD